MQLRPYQQDAFEAAKKWITHCVDPCLIEIATGGGKAHLVAALAHYINTKYKKRVLCIAPSKELVSQNHQKYLLTKNPASIYCASAKRIEYLRKELAELEN